MWTISLPSAVKEIIYLCRNAFVPIMLTIIENCPLMARMFCKPACVDRVQHELGECLWLRSFFLFSPSFRMFRMVYGGGVCTNSRRTDANILRPVLSTTIVASGDAPATISKMNPTPMQARADIPMPGEMRHACDKHMKCDRKCHAPP